MNRGCGLRAARPPSLAHSNEGAPAQPDELGNTRPRQACPGETSEARSTRLICSPHTTLDPMVGTPAYMVSEQFSRAYDASEPVLILRVL